MSYHNGSVWPHDNGIIALGLARYGLTQHAVRIFEGLAEAARYLPLQRLPELFCGFAQRRRAGPTGYPVACAPQAWAAATPIALLAACLGLQAKGRMETVALAQPLLPAFLDWVTIKDLRIGSRGFDVEASRQSSSVRRNKSGNVQVHAA